MASPDLRRADLSGAPVRTLRRGSSYKADLLVYRLSAEDVLLKDYSGKRGVWRDVLGTMSTAREARALRVLDGVQGVPRFRGRPDPYSVAMTFIAGKQVRRDDPELSGNDQFICGLRRIVREMHGRGVVHLDLKHRSNLIMAADGSPAVLDFESSLCLNPRWFGGRLAVSLVGQLDWLAVQNWTRRLCPRMLENSAYGTRQARLIRQTRRWWLPRRILDVLLEILAGRERADRSDA